MSAQIQEYAVAVPEVRTPPFLQSHFNGARSDEAALAKDQFGAAFLVLVNVHADEPVTIRRLRALPRHNHDPTLAQCRSRIAVMTDKVGHLRAVDHVFVGSRRYSA